MAHPKVSLTSQITNYDYRKVVASIHHIIISKNFITVMNSINQINLHHTNNDHHSFSGQIQPDPVKNLIGQQGDLKLSM